MSEMSDVHLGTKHILFNRGLKNEIQTHVLLVPRSTPFNEYVKQIQQADDELYWWNLQKRTVYSFTQKTQHPTVTVTGPQSSDQMKWESTSIAAAKANTQKQSWANWVSKEVIKQYYEKKLCIHCEASGHFRSNCSYYSAQQPTTPTTVANITTIVSEFILHKPDVKEVNDSEKE